MENLRKTIRASSLKKMKLKRYSEYIIPYEYRQIGVNQHVVFKLIHYFNILVAFLTE